MTTTANLNDESADAEAPDAVETPTAAREEESFHSAYPALFSATSFMRFGMVAGLGLTLDLWSKHWAFDTLRQGGRWVIIPRVLEFQTMLNQGALFGLGQGKTTLFLIASIFALALVVWMFSQSSPKRWLLQLALGAIFAGALGNMYDRLFVRLVDTHQNGLFFVNVGQEGQLWRLEEYPEREGGMRRYVSEPPVEVGFVRDFLKIPTRWFTGHELWPWVFNVADTLLVVGVSILALHLWFDRPPPRAADTEASGPPAAETA